MYMSLHKPGPGGSSFLTTEEGRVGGRGKGSARIVPAELVRIGVTMSFGIWAWIGPRQIGQAWARPCDDVSLADTTTPHLDGGDARVASGMSARDDQRVASCTLSKGSVRKGCIHLSMQTGHSDECVISFAFALAWAIACCNERGESRGGCRMTCFDTSMEPLSWGSPELRASPSRVVGSVRARTLPPVPVMVASHTGTTDHGRRTAQRSWWK